VKIRFKINKRYIKMSQKTEEIIEQLKSITLLEAAELITQIEETFGVDSSVNSASSIVMSNASLGDSPSSPQQEEKTEFDVVLEEVPAGQRIPIIKAIRSLTSLGLKEAKDLIDSLPKSIQESISKEEAETSKKLLEEAGGKVTIK
jgi:large subunit ribosomal protein L7/L12